VQLTALQSGWHCIFTQLSGWQHWAGTHSASLVHEEGSPIVVGTGVKSWCGIGSSRIGRAAGEDDETPDQAYHEKEQTGMLHD
jgi:hypothetical protein